MHEDDIVGTGCGLGESGGDRILAMLAAFNELQTFGEDLGNCFFDLGAKGRNFIVAQSDDDFMNAGTRRTCAECGRGSECRPTP